MSRKERIDPVLIFSRTTAADAMINSSVHLLKHPLPPLKPPSPRSPRSPRFSAMIQRIKSGEFSWPDFSLTN
jgi:hypothetical protein